MLLLDFIMFQNIYEIMSEQLKFKMEHKAFFFFFF